MNLSRRDDKEKTQTYICNQFNSKINQSHKVYVQWDCVESVMHKFRCQPPPPLFQKATERWDWVELLQQHTAVAAQ